MANFLQRLVKDVKSLLRKKETVHFKNILQYMRTTQVAARNTQEMINSNVGVFNYLNENLISDIPLDDLSKTDRELKVKYKNILSSTPWTRHIKRPQTMGKFHVFEKTFGVAYKDIDWILDNIDKYFPNTDDTINVEDLTIAQAYILSYVSNIKTTISWFQYLVYNYNLPSKSHVYPYQLAHMDETKDIVEKTLSNGLESDGRSKTVFMRNLESIIKNKKNMRIMVNDQTIDQFASQRDFSSDIESELKGFFNIPLFFGNIILKFQLEIDEYRRTTMDWMNTRIAVIAMDMQELDPNSDEYKKKERILNKYSSDVADFEKKLEKNKEG